MHYNTEHHSFENIEINGKSGLCIDFSGNKAISALLVWDNGDYILEIIGDFDKYDIINLAKSAKVLEN